MAAKATTINNTINYNINGADETSFATGLFGMSPETGLTFRNSEYSLQGFESIEWVEFYPLKMRLKKASPAFSAGD